MMEQYGGQLSACAFNKAKQSILTGFSGSYSTYASLECQNYKNERKMKI